MLKKIMALAIAGASVGQAVAGFHIDYPAVVNTTEQGLMSNRTHYEQKGEASFRMNDADPEPMQKRDLDSGSKLLVDLGYRVVTHEGTPNNEERVRSFADDVPLSNALALIVPKGWRVHQDASLKDKRTADLVSFEGNMRWSDALDVLGERYGYQFHVRWRDRVVEAREGQPVSTVGAGKVRVIDEPAEGEPVRKGFFAQFNRSKTAAQPGDSTAKKDDSQSQGQGAKTFAAPAVAAVSAANATKPDAKPESQSRPDLKNDSATPAVVTPAKVVPKPVVVPKVVLRVQAGTLHENVTRLSQENGWKAPRWNIASDYRVPTNYTLEGESFEAAIFKLLHIHPIEADINRNQKIIYIQREL